jgi:malic enzyme
MIQSMARNPIIFAMANPDPEITPEEVAKIRSDAIMATGRSDYPNQVNNVLGFPYIFRGALDVGATTINDDMKIAAVKALASLAREDVSSGDKDVERKDRFPGKPRSHARNDLPNKKKPDTGDVPGPTKRVCQKRGLTAFQSGL